ncbi:MAG: outer membrane receptor protein involved in Fe transport, partial [Saprospiraceae bacterium]
MKIIHLFLTILILFSQLIQAQSTASAQNTGIIRGKIIAANKEAISYASISIFNNENELVQGSISEDNGAFEFNGLPFGELTIDIQYLGFITFKQSVTLDKKSKKINLGEITMKEDHQQLEEVTVTAEKSQYNLRLDKKVFNVGQDILSRGGSANDVLDQVPLVSVDPSGTVTLRGSSQVQILINGKRSGLTMNNALDQIPSDNIDRVEVITNPSAAYDASGSAGIINIILKKNKHLGLNGQLRASVGSPANHILLPSLNYKGKKLNLFSNFRWRYSDYNGTYTTKQRTTQNGISTFLDQHEDEDRHDDGRSGYIGGDYNFNDQNSITLAYFRSETKDTDLTFLTYNLKDDAQGESNILREGNSVENRDYNQLESNFTRTFKEKGRKFTIDLQYDFWNSNKAWDLLTSGDVDPSDFGTALRTNSKAGNKDFVVKSDYAHPLKNESKIEFGVKLETRIVYNDYNAEILKDDNWTNYNQIDNNIDYSEKIGAAYLQYQNKFKKLEYMFGLRSEYTLLDIKDDKNTFSKDSDYLNLFPSMHLSYSLSENNKVQWSYSRRINRPSLWSLFPFSEIKDFNLQEIGNPNLQPSFSNSLEISFLSVHDKLTINPAIYYRQTDKPISNFLSQDNQETFIIQPINIDKKE